MNRNVEVQQTIQEHVFFLMHRFAYEYTKDFSKNSIVLYIGCGSGYGDDILVSTASAVIALDIDKSIIKYANSKYNNEKIYFIVGDGYNLPLRKNAFDLVVSFQVIEHIEPAKVLHYLKEIRRVFKSNGTCIITTPNRLLRSLPFQKPRNPEHKKEYDYKELRSLLTKVFSKVCARFISSEFVVAVERNRVHQSPFMIFKVLLKRVLEYMPNKIHTYLCSVVTRSTSIKHVPELKRDKHNHFMKLINTNHFYITNSNLKKYLHVYAICEK